jgi:hypothetical protein
MVFGEVLVEEAGVGRTRVVDETESVNGNATPFVD